MRSAAVEHLARHGVGQQDIDGYLSQTRASPDSSITTRRQLVQNLVSQPLFFSYDIARTRDGFYRYRGCLDVVTQRALAFAPYAELLGAETGKPDMTIASRLAESVRRVHPDKGLVHSLSPSFNWAGAMGWDKLKSFTADLAKCGFVLQIVSLAGFHSTAIMAAQLSRRFKRLGDDGVRGTRPGA